MEGADNNSSSSSSNSVNLVTSGASLLSGKLEECSHPQDPTCEGGIASVAAFARRLITSAAVAETMTFIQKFDKKSPFVNMHELQWIVNRLVMREVFNLNVFISNPSLLLQNSVDSDVSIRDISDLQSKELPLLLSNTQISPSSSWHPYTKAIHFDPQTGLAVANIADSPIQQQIDAAKGILRYIDRLNEESGCWEGASTQTEYEVYRDRFEASLLESSNSTLTNQTATNDPPTCWTSVILFQDGERNYYLFLEAITVFEHPPDFVLNLEDAYESFPVPQKYSNTNVWVGTCPMDEDTYCQHRITTDTNHKISNVEFIQHDLEELPDSYKDETWASHIQQLNVLARDARLNNPIVGYSLEMPVVRNGELRFCEAGECPVGNLFADALRWYTQTDIAFLSSGGFKGSGWPAGPVRLTDIYAALQFPNTECVGTMTGLSLFRMIEHITRIVPFDAIDTDEGGQLLQVSGMKITYNTKITGSRLIAVDIWDKETSQYLPIERLKLYTFVTDSFMCSAYDRFPEFTGTALTLEGEVPGVVGNDEIVQNMVSNYLVQLGEEPYDTSIQNRLFNATNVFDVLTMLQSEESCAQNTVWNENTATCVPCPIFDNVAFSDEILEFASDNDAVQKPSGRVVLVNREAFDVSVLLRSQPRWLDFTKVVSHDETEVEDLSDTIEIQTGGSLVLEFALNPSNLLASGTDRSAIATVNFGVLGGASTEGCVGRDVTFDVALRVTPPDQLNSLGGIRYVGFSLFGIIVTTAMAFSIWVFRNRHTRVVKILQPAFLMCILVGVLLLSAAIIPLSIDDGITSVRGCNIACMAAPWLLSSGFVISACALFCKLWRINRLFHGAQKFRRVTVKMHNVMAPFVVIFALNFAMLLVWTLLDPWKWERRVIGDQKWNTYGTCQGGSLSIIMASLLGALNFFSLTLSCHQAYKARNISGEFSESTYIGIAVYGWVQILLVGGPILFLVDPGDPTTIYFVQVAIIFIVSISMLLLIFIPGFMNKKKVNASKHDTANANFERSMEMAAKDKSRHAIVEPVARSSFQHTEATNGGTRSAKISSQSLQMNMISIKECEESDSDSDDSAPSMDPVSAARARKRQIEDQIHEKMHESVNGSILGMVAKDGLDGLDDIDDMNVPDELCDARTDKTADDSA